MEDVINLTQGRSSWNYRLDTELPKNFNQAVMFLVAKMWMQFISTRIAPALNVFNVNVFQIVLLDDILQRKQKDQSKVRKGTQRDIDAELDRMIRWMLETKPELQEFARMNGLHVLNYPPDMFRQTLTHQDEGVNLEEKSVSILTCAL
ncbi:hypothetical protein Goklo_012596 [Gossypium klotzschianum]|uniref:Uncharacterized protein n=1 Tax=Gossypium klotzschianum TaxID=34286 RepID=A0A7J8VCR3_9ROSI|nr:hypothetical protein [Gossypium klotzschianum]